MAEEYIEDVGLSTPISYAQAVNANAGQASHSPSDPLCPYAEASGICKKLDCPYLHGDICDLCGAAALHPYNEEHRKKHTNVTDHITTYDEFGVDELYSLRTFDMSLILFLHRKQSFLIFVNFVSIGLCQAARNRHGTFFRHTTQSRKILWRLFRNDNGKVHRGAEVRDPTKM